MNWISSRVAVAGAIAIIGVAGCAGTTSNPAVPSAPPSVTASAITSPTLTPSAAPTPSPTPAPPLTLVPTGNMHAARGGATATLLKNGKVLIAGGEAAREGANQSLTWTYYASAEIYDPATGKFANTGSMTAARADATAVRLADGRVLIAGGDGCWDPKHCTNIQGEAANSLLSADIYDPATGKFTRTGSLTADVSTDQAAVLLPDGKVMMAIYGPAAELFDPTTGEFTSSGRTGSSPPNTATLLLNGKVLVTGDSSVPLLYDEATGKFTKISLALPPGTPSAAYKDGSAIRRGNVYTATLLNDGRVLLFEDGYLETYDPATGTCADVGFISPGGDWVYPTATLLADGRVLFAGGGLNADPVGFDSAGTNVAVVYDPSSGQVSSGLMKRTGGGMTATLLLDGSVLIAGGADSDGDPLSSAELFKP